MAVVARQSEHGGVVCLADLCTGLNSVRECGGVVSVLVVIWGLAEPCRQWPSATVARRSSVLCGRVTHRARKKNKWKRRWRRGSRAHLPLQLTRDAAREMKDGGGFNGDGGA